MIKSIINWIINWIIHLFSLPGDEEDYDDDIYNDWYD